MMSTNQVIVVTICTVLTLISGSDIPDCPAADQGISFTSEPTNVEVCGRDTATFYCRYEGSMANPDWIINFTIHTSANLPRHHSYHVLDGTLSVTNIIANQNNTQYQCRLLSWSDGQLCAYRSTVGRIIIKCRNNQNSIFLTSGSRIEPTATAISKKSDLQSIQSSTLIQIGLVSETSWHFYEVTTESPSNSRTPTSLNNNTSTIENVSTSGLTLSVAIALGLAVTLIGVALLIIPIGLIVCLKNGALCQRKANQENIYDEPSQPDPVYQEVTVKSACTKIEMMENCSYMTTRITANSVTVLQQCPAYIKHEDIHCT